MCHFSSIPRQDWHTSQDAELAFVALPASKIIALLLLSMAWQIFLQHYSSTGSRRAWLSEYRHVAKYRLKLCVINSSGIWGNGRNKI